MSEISPEQTEFPNPPENDATEPGFLVIEEKPVEPEPASPVAAAPSPPVRPATPSPAQMQERAGTVEHLAARRSLPEIDASAPEIKERLTELRMEVTRLLTALRWHGETVQNTAEGMIPLLNVGSVSQWKAVLIPFLLEIDRAGNFIPVWLKIIEQGDPTDLRPEANPAETMVGRARRFAILMLGNYKAPKPSGKNVSLGFSKQSAQEGSARAAEIIPLLRKLATDPNTSLYATQALVKQGTTTALEVLVGALKDAEGWAKVDIVEACLSLEQARFYDLLLASGLDRAAGLESYIAIPLYRTLPLQDYLRGRDVSPRLAQQAALIFQQVLQDSMNPPPQGASTLPVVFDGNLPEVATALFEGARSSPTWQNTLAVHRLGLFLGRYWSAIARGEIKEARIQEPVYKCLPMMADVERWMAGPGRDVLLSALADAEAQEALQPVVKVLGELREPRSTSSLIRQIEEAQAPADRTHALVQGAICDTLGLLGDQRAVPVMLQFLHRAVDTGRRAQQPRRRDNLPSGDADIPGSIVYAAIVRACGQLGDQQAMESVLGALNDCDPYVRTQAIEALKRLDPTGSDTRSRAAVREALNDPRDSVVRAACQLALQYHDFDAASALELLAERRPELAALAYDVLRQIRA